MLTRTDLATFDRRYRRFRAELRHTTQIDDEVLARYISLQGKPFVITWVAITGGDGSVLDFQEWAREQFARDRGLFGRPTHTESQGKDHVDIDTTSR